MNKIVNKLKDKLPQFCNTQDFWYVKFKDKLHFALFGGRKCVLERSLCGA